MADHVHQQSPTSLVGQEPPRRRLEPGVFNQRGPNQDHLAQYVCLQQVLDLVNYRIKSAVVRDSEFYTVAAAHIHHALALGNIHGHRFFAEYVFASFSCLNGMETVQEDRGGEIHGVDIRIGENLGRILTPFRNAMPLLKFPQPLGLLSGARQQLGTGCRLKSRSHPLLSDIAASHQSPTNGFFHPLAPQSA